MPKQKFTCAECGAEFEAYASKSKNPRFCSRACSVSSKRRGSERICPVCGTCFIPRKSEKYCSTSCYKQHQKEMVERPDDKRTEQLVQGTVDYYSHTEPEDYHSAKDWLLKSPEGVAREISNLRNFCKLNFGNFPSAYSALAHGKSYKGWLVVNKSDGNTAKRKKSARDPSYCAICGKNVPYGRKYCSRECRNAEKLKEQRLSKVPVIKKCPVCQKELVAVGKKIYCSAECAAVARKELGKIYAREYRSLKKEKSKAD